MSGEEEEREEEMFSTKYVSSNRSVTVFEEMKEAEPPLRKRPKTEYPPPSSSLYSLVHVSNDSTREMDRRTEMRPFMAPERGRTSNWNVTIPGVTSILEGTDSLFPLLAAPNRSFASTPEMPGFTPFLLPNPTSSYYNPLNPPRRAQVNNNYKVPPMYPPQFIKESSSCLHHPILKDQQINDPIGAMASTLPSSHHLSSGQSSSLSSSTIHFPLSDSPNKVFKRPSSSGERLLGMVPKASTEQLGGGPPLLTTDNATTTNRFILVEQPNDIQRKSYKKENRCLLPNPLIICMKDPTEVQKKSPPTVLDGTVTLKLVNNDGTELPPHKQNALESIEGGLTHPLGDDHTACFSVKVLQTSEGNLFRLVFQVSYRLKGEGRIEEQIISRPFAVYSNKHNRNSRKKQKNEVGCVELL